MFSLRLLCIFGCFLVLTTALPVELTAKGGVKTLSGDKLKEAEDVLKDSLSKLATGDGPNYTLSEIHSATRQTVSGSLYKYVVDLLDQDNHKKECNVSIWSRPWLEDGIEVTFECDGAEKLIKKHSA